MVADMVAFVASQFTTSTWDVGAQELCSVVLIYLKLRRLYLYPLTGYLAPKFLQPVGSLISELKNRS